jgi:hypothetical protein
VQVAALVAKLLPLLLPFLQLRGTQGLPILGLVQLSAFVTSSLSRSLLAFDASRHHHLWLARHAFFVRICGLRRMHVAITAARNQYLDVLWCIRQAAPPLRKCRLGCKGYTQ